MEKITFYTFDNKLTGKIEEHVLIETDSGNTTMLKSVYDEQQAALPKQEWVEPQLTK